MFKVGILGLARRAGTFAEVGLRSWEEAGCAAVERALMAADNTPYVIHRPLVVRGVCADIEQILCDWCDVPNPDARCALILTVGGTGFTRDDIMPEATTAVIERSLPGVCDLLRSHAPARLDDVSYDVSYLRGAAGLRGSTLIINLPGPIRGVAAAEKLTESVELLLPLLPAMLHAAQE